MSQEHSIAVLGLGAMGSALALAFLKAGLKTHIWNRTTDRPGVKEVISRGGPLKETVSSAIQSDQLIVICLTDYDCIYSNLDSLPRETFSGKTIINLTNGTPSQARSMSQWMHERGTQYFDGGIMNTPEEFGSARAFIFISGDDQASFETMKDTLSPIGRLDYLGPDPGAAVLFDNALLAGMYGMFGGALTSIALLSKSSTSSSTSQVVEENLMPMLQALLPYLGQTAEFFDQKDWRSHTANVSVMEGGLRNIVATCEDEGVDSGLLRKQWELFDQVVKEGRGQEGLASLVRDLVKG